MSYCYITQDTEMELLQDISLNSCTPSCWVPGCLAPIQKQCLWGQDWLVVVCMVCVKEWKECVGVGDSVEIVFHLTAALDLRKTFPMESELSIPGQS